METFCHSDRSGGISYCLLPDPRFASSERCLPATAGLDMTKNPFCADTVHARDTAAAFQPPFGLKSAIWKSPLLVSPPPVHSVSEKNIQNLAHLSKFLPIQ